MMFVSKAASFAVARAIPALTSIAIANPITATVLTVGSVGLATWKGSEVAIKSAPLVRAFKNRVHCWTAPEAVKQAAQKAASEVHQAATTAELQVVAQAAIKAAEAAHAIAEEATRRAAQASEHYHEGIAPIVHRQVNGAAAA